jgi:hypothetical protein
MTRMQELRRQAALHRRVASIPTHGDRVVDRILISLAERLEREAEKSEEEQRRHNNVYHSFSTAGR